MVQVALFTEHEFAQGFDDAFYVVRGCDYRFHARRSVDGSTILSRDERGEAIKAAEQLGYKFDFYQGQ